MPTDPAAEIRIEGWLRLVCRYLFYALDGDERQAEELAELVVGAHLGAAFRASKPELLLLRHAHRAARRHSRQAAPRDGPAETRGKAGRGLAGVDEQQRQALILRVLLRFSREEASYILCLPEQQVEHHVSCGLRALRESGACSSMREIPSLCF